MKEKLRKRYSILTFLLLIIFILITILGGLNVGDFDNFGSTMAVYTLFGMICAVFSALAFFVCLSKKDEYTFKGNNTKTAAEVSAASIGVPISGISNGFRVGPRARYIAPIFIINAISLLSSIEILPLFKDYSSLNTNIIYYLFTLCIIAEIIAIYAAIVCRKYNQLK